MIEVVKSADGTTLGKCSLWSRSAKRRSPALPRLGDHHVPVNVQSREVVEGRGSHASAQPIRGFVLNPPPHSPVSILLRALLHRNTHWCS